jgi:TonB family protein
MALSGHSTDLSLADLLQANLLGRNTCRIMLAAPEGRGVIYVEHGTVVDAHFVDLLGDDAFYALVTEDDVYFQVDTGVEAPARTISTPWQHLMIEAMRLKDEGRLPKPQPPLLMHGEVSARPAEAPLVSSVVAPAESGVPSPPVATRPRSRLLVAVSTLVVLGAVAAAVVTASRGGGRHAAGSAAVHAAVIVPFEASSLTGRGDEPPFLLEGPVPHSPDASSVIKPTVVCRILVDEHGAVTAALVFRPRGDIEPFEKAALAAVAAYRFRPARRAGRPVPAWLNLPISFQ